MIGLRRGAVRLEPHTELWHRLYAEEEARLRAAVGGRVVAFEHVGSTAVCGISAKPIIDIAAAVLDAAEAERCVGPLQAIGYEYRGDGGIAGRFYFVKGEQRTHHLHMSELGSDIWRNHLAFRDYLRQHPTAADEYERLKRDLASKYRNDRGAYTEGKAAFIEAILKLV